MPNTFNIQESVAEESLTLERRQFLKKVATGAVSATVLLVYKQVSAAVKAAAPEGFPPRKHNYAYVIDISKCIGCGNCVRACSIENEVPAGVFRTWVERYVTTDEGIFVDSPNGSKDGFQKVADKQKESCNRSFFVPKLCNHCHDAPCIQVCPVGATFQNSEGFVLIDPEHCIGCSYCVQSCPYGVRFINPRTKKADKCTWCYHRVKKDKLPACVTVCPTGARMFGDLNDADSEIAKTFKEDKWLVLKPDMHTDSYCFYIGLPKEVV